jgi:hypothetical protein
MTCREHPSRVAKLLEGRLVIYPPAEAEDCTIWVPLPDGEDEWEGILAKRLRDKNAELVGIPVFAYGLDLGDVVRVDSTIDGADVFGEIVEKAGNRTFRALFDAESERGEHWLRLMADLEPFGCWFDTWSETLIAIAAPEAGEASVAAYLRERESRGELKYEAA